MTEERNEKISKTVTNNNLECLNHNYQRWNVVLLSRQKQVNNTIISRTVGCLLPTTHKITIDGTISCDIYALGQ